MGLFDHSWPSGGGFPALVPDDVTLRHEELSDYMEMLLFRHVRSECVVEAGAG